MPLYLPSLNLYLFLLRGHNALFNLLVAQVLKKTPHPAHNDLVHASCAFGDSVLCQNTVCLKKITIKSSVRAKVKDHSDKKQNLYHT